jgi:hypothetical protein
MEINKELKGRREKSGVILRSKRERGCQKPFSPFFFSFLSPFLRRPFLLYTRVIQTRKSDEIKKWRRGGGIEREREGGEERSRSRGRGF